MADVWYKAGSFVTPASGTTVLGSLPGTGPVFIRLWWGNNTSDNTVQAHQQFGMGMSDGTDHDCMTFTAQDGANLNERDARNANWCLISDPTSTGTDIVLGSSAAMNTNDVTLSYTTHTAGRIVNYEIWGGSGTTVNMIQYGAAVANSPVSHGLGSKPDLVMVMTAGQAHPASSIHSYFSFGVATDNGASIDQWNLHSFFGDSDTDFVGAALTSGDIAGQYDSDFADWDSTVTAISTTTVTWSETAGPGADQNIMAVLNFQGDGAVDVDVGTFAKSTATAPATQAMPDLGFQPLGYALFTANYDSLTKPGTNTDRIAHRSEGAFDGTDGVVATTVGTTQSNADRASIMVDGEVLQGSQALQASGVQFSGTPQAIDSQTPEIEWNPNTTGATDDVFIGYYAVENTNLGETATGAPSVILPTSAGTATVERNATGSPSVILPTAAGTAEVIKTATGAPEIILPTAAGTASVVFPATGAPEIILPTASGTAKIIKKATGAAVIALTVAAGVASVERNATGAPVVFLPVAAGVAQVIKTATGSPSILLPTAAGVAEVIKVATGAPEIILPTSAGTASVDAGANTATGAPSIILPTASGAAEIIKPATGAPSILLPVAAGVAEAIKPATGSPSILLPTSAGTASVSFAAKDTSVRVTFGTPAAIPALGVGLQRFKMNVRRDAAHVGGSGIPTIDVFLYEDGVQRGSALVSGVAITSDVGQVVEALWDAADLVTSSSGSAVECFIQATANGAGADRRAVEVGAIEWCTIADSGTFANGAPEIILPTSSGAAIVGRSATGAPSIILPTAAGVAEIIKTADGAASIILPTSAGEAEILNTATGNPSIILPTAAGVAEIIKPADGAPSIILPTSAGTAGVERNATGAPVLPLITSAGVATVEGVSGASGAPEIFLPTSAGVAEIIKTADGAPSIILPTSSGAAELVFGATGAPEIFLPTSSGVAEVIKTADGSPAIILPTSSGAAEVIKTATGSPQLPLIESAGVADVEGMVSATGAPSIPLPTAAGVATVVGGQDEATPVYGKGRKPPNYRRLLDEDELLFVIITAFLQIKDE